MKKYNSGEENFGLITIVGGFLRSSKVWSSRGMRSALKLMALLSFVFQSSAAFAEVRNEADVFVRQRSCGAYENFLNGKPTGSVEECHELERFIIEHDGPEITSYLRKLSSAAGAETSLGAAASALFATVYGEKLQAFNFSESAKRRMTIMLTTSGDVERATVYSHFFYDLQVQFLRDLCSGDRPCEIENSLSKIQDLLGADFEFLSHHRADRVLICLLKTDAFTVPIRDVLNSTKYLQCLKLFER